MSSSPEQSSWVIRLCGAAASHTKFVALGIASASSGRNLCLISSCSIRSASPSTGVVVSTIPFCIPRWSPQSITCMRIPKSLSPTWNQCENWGFTLGLVEGSPAMGSSGSTEPPAGSEGGCQTQCGVVVGVTQVLWFASSSFIFSWLRSLLEYGVPNFVQ